MLDELKDQQTSPKNNAKRIDVFKRLKNKFSILLPPPNVDVRLLRIQYLVDFRFSYIYVISL